MSTTSNGQGRAGARPLPFALLLAPSLALVSLSCGSAVGTSAGPGGDRGAPWFQDVTSELGLPQRQQPWPDGTYALPEIIGSGVGLLDHDADGDLDILHVRFPPPGEPHAPAPNRLYEQTADGTFVDATERSGIGDPGFGQGLAVGDVDDDGAVDVYFTNYGPDALYRNNGDGTFREATAAAGFTGDRWSSAATFCDYDRDGDLDLYVVHYLRFDGQTCLNERDLPDYCGPQVFHGVPDVLYRNEGGGRFVDVTAEAGLSPPGGGERARGLGVVCTDLSGDGLADFYVANDGEPNHLWVNQGDGTFREEATIRGVAVNREGRPEASMGLAVGDVDRDGRFDLFVTHLFRETNTLYLAGRGPLFSDESARWRLSDHDIEFTGFGCGFLDFDNDGDLDLIAVNGRVYRGDPRPGAAVGEFWSNFAEPNLLWEHDGSGRFLAMPQRAGRLVADIEVTRGLALGDLDHDGDVDVVLSNADNTIRVFRNDAPRRGARWLSILPLTGRRVAVGAVVRVEAAGRSLTRVCLPASSYLSSSDGRVHFGLGAAERVDGVEVLWPDGGRERFTVGQLDSRITLRQGEGTLP